MNPITAHHRRQFARDGHLVIPGLFDESECATWRDHYMTLRAKGSYPHDMVAEKPLDRDPLQHFPRMIHMHRWDEITKRWLLDARLDRCLAALLGVEPLAVQSMIYFKPPQARGQALHQDQYYLNVHPGTCLAAWLALDAADEANGCLRVVPGSHTWPLLCAQKADSASSFTSTAVPVPEGVEIRPIRMGVGDVLFFHGLLVHGSLPNTTRDRFRRSLIGHYIPSTATQVTEFDQPVLRMDGTELRIAPSPFGGPCGEWVDRDGTPVLELTGFNRKPTWSHE